MFVYINIILYLCNVKQERRCEYEMKQKQRLIFRILDLLAIIETSKNQPIVNRIKGYLFELLDEI